MTSMRKMKREREDEDDKDDDYQSLMQNNGIANDAAPRRGGARSSDACPSPIQAFFIYRQY